MQNYYTYSYFVRQKYSTYSIFVYTRVCTLFLISANLSLSSMPGVWCRALYDVKRTRSTFRDGDSLLSCKGNLCDYVGGHGISVYF